MYADVSIFDSINKIYCNLINKIITYDDLLIIENNNSFIKIDICDNSTKNKIFNYKDTNKSVTFINIKYNLDRIQIIHNIDINAKIRLLYILKINVIDCNNLTFKLNDLIISKQYIYDEEGNSYMISIFNEINNLYNKLSNNLITLNKLIELLEIDDELYKLEIAEIFVKNDIDISNNNISFQKRNKNIYIMNNVNISIRLMYIFEIKDMTSNLEDTIIELKDIRIIQF